jgi:hypothetical protein
MGAVSLVARSPNSRNPARHARHTGRHPHNPMRLAYRTASVATARWFRQSFRQALLGREATATERPPRRDSRAETGRRRQRPARGSRSEASPVGRAPRPRFAAPRSRRTRFLPTRRVRRRSPCRPPLLSLRAHRPHTAWVLVCVPGQPRGQLPQQTVAADVGTYLPVRFASRLLPAAAPLRLAAHRSK